MRRAIGLAVLAAALTSSAAGAADVRGTARGEVVRGSAGSDFIDPRSGRDRVLALGGNDRIKAFDGAVDDIRCGAGGDVVAADLGDRVATDCETVSRRLAVDRISDPSFVHSTHVEPDSFAFGSTVVAVYQVGRAPAPGGAASAIGFSTSRDGGRRWRSGILPGLTPNTRPRGPWARASDPVIGYDARHGVWLASSLVTTPNGESGLTFNRSADGLAWGPPVVATRTPGPGLGVDKQWFACDNWPSSPFYGRCYLAYTDVARGDRISLQTSSDGALTWSQPIGSPENAPRGNRESPGVQPVVRPNGELVVVYLEDDGISALRSSDGGQTLSRAQVVARASPARPRDFRAFSLPSADVDSTGVVYVAWMDCSPRRCNGRGADLVLVRSSADSTRWSLPDRVPLGPTAVGTYYTLPGLAADPARPGRLALAYYRLLGNGAIDAFFSASTDAGVSWARPTRLSPQSMRRSWLPVTQYGPMIGDYISTSFVAGRPIPILVLAAAPRGARLEESVFAARP